MKIQYTTLKKQDLIELERKAKEIIKTYPPNIDGFFKELKEYEI